MWGVEVAVGLRPAMPSVSMEGQQIVFIVKIKLRDMII